MVLIIYQWLRFAYCILQRVGRVVLEHRPICPISLGDPGAMWPFGTRYDEHRHYYIFILRAHDRLIHRIHFFFCWNIELMLLYRGNKNRFDPSTPPTVNNAGEIFLDNLMSIRFWISNWEKSSIQMRNAYTALQRSWCWLRRVYTTLPHQKHGFSYFVMTRTIIGTVTPNQFMYRLFRDDGTPV